MDRVTKIAVFMNLVKFTTFLEKSCLVLRLAGLMCITDRSHLYCYKSSADQIMLHIDRSCLGNLMLGADNVLLFAQEGIVRYSENNLLDQEIDIFFEILHQTISVPGVYQDE
jgi:hypothetical protein